MGGIFLATPKVDHWEIKFFDPDSARLYNRHITSYTRFLGTNSNGSWHTHHAQQMQEHLTHDKKTKVAFSNTDYSYFELAQEPSIVAALNKERKSTIQIMVQNGVYCIEED